MMKMILATLKPRNPLVVESLRCKAGSHRAGDGARRQLGKPALLRELGGPAIRDP